MKAGYVFYQSGLTEHGYERYLFTMNSQPATLPVSDIGTPSHRDLIFRAGGPAKVGDSLKPPVDGNTVKAWARLDSIPGPYWQGFAEAQLATLEELAAAAEAKRRAAVPEGSEQVRQ
jgi:hypothetical protein